MNDKGLNRENENDLAWEYFLNGLARGAAFALASVAAIVIIFIAMFRF